MAKICVIGAGYVGLSTALLLARDNTVYLYDIDSNKRTLIQNKISPLKERQITDLLHEDLKLYVKDDLNSAIEHADIAFLCTPTDFDEKDCKFNTTSLTSLTSEIFTLKQDIDIVIKSTIPIGFTDSLCENYDRQRLHFCPEFLREGSTIYDLTHPSRIIVGTYNKAFGQKLIDILSLFVKGSCPILITRPKEAEAIKLFSNTYLAMRIAFFNELDSYALQNGLDSKTVIEGMGFDSRIGNYYNNPSFGYGGYCLPKDAKELNISFNSKANHLIKAVVMANTIRKETIVESILKTQAKTVGIYRLAMKKDSDNFRQSAIIDIIKMLGEHKVNLIIYEPTLEGKSFMSFELENDFDKFYKKADLVVANRLDERVKGLDKIFSRDIFFKS